jgi:hypothetical protein
LQYSDFSGIRPRINAAVANGITSRSSASGEGGDIAAATSAWFTEFLIDRVTREPSDHTMKAYRQDFTAVADLLSAGPPSDIALTDITKMMMRAAFAAKWSPAPRPPRGADPRWRRRRD